MMDLQETEKVNNAMVEIMKQSLTDPRIMLSIEGYLVTSDSNQNPHTSVEIFLNRLDRSRSEIQHSIPHTAMQEWERYR